MGSGGARTTGEPGEEQHASKMFTSSDHLHITLCHCLADREDTWGINYIHT